MPPISRFGSTTRADTKQTIIDKLKAFFETYAGLGTGAPMPPRPTFDPTAPLPTLNYPQTDETQLLFAADPPITPTP